MERIYILLAAAVFVSCSALRPVIAQSDSTRVEVLEKVVYKDSTVLVQLPAEFDKSTASPDDSSHLETTIAESDAYIREGKLIHTLRNKQEALLPVVVRIPEAKVQKTEYLLRTQTIEKPVKMPLTAWENFFILAGKIALGLLLLRVIIAAGKKYLL